MSEMPHDVAWAKAPPRLCTKADLDALLFWANEAGASDITLQDGTPPFAKVNGRYRPIIQRALDNNEIQSLLTAAYAGNWRADLDQGRPIRTSYAVMLDPATRDRLRVRLTMVSHRVEGVRGYSGTIRLLPRDIPDIFDKLGVEPELVDAFNFKAGVAVVGGKVESGKTTLMASLLAHRIKQPGYARKVIHIGRPIEYGFGQYASGALVTQVEVPQDMKDFATGLTAFMSMTPDIILNEEVNDEETVSATLDAAQTGVACEATLHIESVANLPRRIAGLYRDGAEGDRRVASAFESLRVVVVQRLEEAIKDGDPTRRAGRVGIREFLILDEAMRSRLVATKPVDWHATLRDMVLRYGQPMVESARKLCDAGRLSRARYEAIAAGRAM